MMFFIFPLVWYGAAILGTFLFTFIMTRRILKKISPIDVEYNIIDDTALEGEIFALPDHKEDDVQE